MQLTELDAGEAETIMLAIEVDARAVGL